MEQHQTPALSNSLVTLVPFNTIEDWDYLFEIAKKYRYNVAPRYIVEALVLRHGMNFWKVYDTETKTLGGVVYLSHYPNMGYFLDAYRDHSVSKKLTHQDWSYQAGKLVTQFFFDNYGGLLYTTHCILNRSATVLCKRLGFKSQYEYATDCGLFVMMLNKGERYGS